METRDSGHPLSSLLTLVGAGPARTSSLATRAWLMALTASGLLTLLAGCSTVRPALVGADGRPLGGVALRLEGNAPGFHFGQVRYLLDGDVKLDTDDAGAVLTRALDNGEHRLDADVEYVSKGDAAHPGSSVRVERTVHFTVTPGCQARIAVVLGRGLSADEPEVSLDVHDCAQRAAIAPQREGLASLRHPFGHCSLRSPRCARPSIGL